MDETFTPPEMPDGPNPWSLRDDTRNLEQTIFVRIHERLSKLDLYSDPSHYTSIYMDQKDATIRPRYLDYYRQEIAELQALDPHTASLEAANAISKKYSDLRDSLAQS